MKAIVYTEYGPPGVFQITDVVKSMLPLLPRDNSRPFRMGNERSIGQDKQHLLLLKLLAVCLELLFPRRTHWLNFNCPLSNKIALNDNPISRTLQISGAWLRVAACHIQVFVTQNRGDFG